MAVKITLNGDGLNYDGEVTLLQATQIMGFIAQLSSTKASENLVTSGSIISESSSLLPTNIISAYESPRAAIDSLGAKTNPQKIIALALYLGATSENGILVSNEQILAEFTKAGESTPKNILRDLKDAVNLGYIYQESKSTFRLLSTVNTIPQNGFKKAKKNTTIKYKEKNTEKLEISEAVKTLRIVSDMTGYISYFDVQQRSDEVLWILKYADQEKIVGLNRLEIIHISGKIGGNLNSKSFTSANVSNKKNGYISLEGSLFSITPKGNKHLIEDLASKED